MSPGTALVVLAGWFAGSLVFVAMARWAFLLPSKIAERAMLRKPGGKAATFAAIAVRSLLHAGPWLLITVAVIAYGVRNEPWAMWLYVGFGIALLMFGVPVAVVALRLARKHKSASPSHAA
jgi:hypothetical protein